MSEFGFSAQSLRPLRLGGELTFELIHRRYAEDAEEAQRIQIHTITRAARRITSVMLFSVAVC
jgi:hypothetical protein